MEFILLFPPDLRYTKEHIWARLENGNIHVGITDFAQEKLDDIVFVELPAVGTHIKVDEKFGIIESVKDTSNLIAPVTGEVVEVNQALEDEPELVNSDPYSGGWMVVIKPSGPKELENLLTADAYQKLYHKSLQEIVSKPKPKLYHKSLQEIVSKPKPKFAPWTTGGRCDVCNEPLHKGAASKIPVDVFYSSPKYKEWFRHNMMPRIRAMGAPSTFTVDMALADMRSKDPTSYSAVCGKCVKLFS